MAKRKRTDQQEEQNGAPSSSRRLIQANTASPSGVTQPVDTRAIYRPLKAGHIRVLKLLPGEFEAPLRASLHHVDLDAVAIEGRGGTQYEAVSYAWGSSVFDQTIEIQNRGILKITSSLHCALQHFRRTDRARRLWADAICINQLDNEEKGKQVRRMMDVYKKASKVLVWFGPEESGDDLAFAFLGVFDAFEKSYMVTNTTDDYRRYFEDHRPEHRQHVDLKAGLSAVSRLFNRQWFSRLWVLQEVACRSTDDRGIVLVASGFQLAEWHSLHIAIVMLIDALEEHSLHRPSRFHCSFTSIRTILDELRNIYTPPNHIWAGALEMIINSGTRRCSVAHDRIYAMYGIAQLTRFDGLEPDYSLSVGEVYRRFVTTMLESQVESERRRRKSYAMLALVGTESSEAEKDPRPSWVPHFQYLSLRSRNKYYHYKHDFPEHLTQFGIAFEMPFDCAFDGSETAKFRATCFGTITEILHSSMWPERHRPPHGETDLLSRIFEWYHRCKQFAIERILFDKAGDQNILQLEMLFLCGNSPDSAKLNRVGFENVGSEHDVLKETIDQLDMTDRSVITTIWRVIAERYLYHFGHRLHSVRDLDRQRNLCSFITSNGNVDIGWAPVSAQEGDELCVLAGAQYPFVVRKAGGDFYTLLGDAWTLKTTLKEALGGVHRCPFPEECRRQEDFPPCISWDSEEEEMRDLIADMGWITLK